MKFGGRLPAGSPVIAHDVGGTFTKSMLVGADGTILQSLHGPTGGLKRQAQADATSEVRAELVRRTAKFRKDHPDVAPDAVGVVVPGVVDEREQLARYSANLGWHDLPLGRLLSDDLGLPVRLGHDVRAGTLAEHSLGAAQGVDEVTVVVIGTGIAAGIVTGGRLVSVGGYAGEVGHAVILPGGPMCGCGGRGHLEAIASAGAIAQRYEQASGDQVDGAREVLRRRNHGDPLARRMWAEATDALAMYLCMLIATLSPEVVVLSGGLALAGADLLDPIRDRIEEELTFQRAPDLRLSTLGEDAGMIGAALLAREQPGGGENAG